MAKLLRTLGVIYLIMFAVIWSIGVLGVLMKYGFWQFLWTISPFNIANFIVTILALLPAYGLFKLAEKVESRVANKN